MRAELVEVGGGGWQGRKPDPNAVSGVHTLITGLNGHGKTLMLVGEKLLPLVGSVLDYEAPDGTKRKAERRFFVAGVRGLALPHELMEAPEVNPERFVDEWKDTEREAGSAPLEVLHTIQNWWCWVQPGDVLVVDEAQGAFPAFASGRAIPTYIRKLNTARHYGVQFIYLTQFPAMLHANLRALIGPHEDVRRSFGSASAVVVYQWDRVNPQLNIRTATKRLTRHNKAVFGLYKSAAAHTNFRQRLPLAVWVLLGSMVALPFLGWNFYDKVFGKPLTMAPGGQAPGKATAPPTAAVARPVGPAGPVLAVSAAVPNREPYAGLGVHIAGSFELEGVRRTWFSLSIGGKAVGLVSDKELHRAGYAWRTNGAPCAGVLIFGELERAVTCDVPIEAPRQSGGPAPAKQADTIPTMKVELPSLLAPAGSV